MTESLNLRPECEKVLLYMEHHRTVTVRELFDVLKVNSPTKVISDLVKAGVPILKNRVNVYDRDGKIMSHYTEYTLRRCGYGNKTILFCR